MNIKKVVFYILALLPIFVGTYLYKTAQGGLGDVVPVALIFIPALILGVSFLILALLQPWSMKPSNLKKFPQKVPALVVIVTVLGVLVFIYWLLETI